MNKVRFILGLAAITIILYLDSCSSGKSSYERGNYYESVMTSINRLRRNTDHKKSVETLRQAYPLAVQYYEDQAKNAMASSNEFKWSAVVQSYTYINSMYDEIKRSPGALAVIPNPVNYYGKLEEARKNAAEENYVAGVNALSLGNREKAKQAYRFFKTANEFVAGYKAVNKKMEEALWVATVKVVVTPIPATKNVAVSAQFFDDKISEFVHTASINEFVKFYTQKEAQTLKLNPDHIIQLEFDEFSVGQVALHEKQIQLEKDSVVVATYITPASLTNQNSQTQNQTGGSQQGTTTQPNAGSTNSSQQSTTGTNQNTGTQTPENTTGNTNPQTNAGSQANQNQTSQSNQTDTNTQTGNQANNQGTTQNNQGGSQSDQNQGNQNTTTNDPTNQNTNTEQEEKVTICHIPPGNTSNLQTLIIPKSALQAHLDHGDKLGFCEDSKGNSAKPAPPKKGANGNGSTGMNKPLFKLDESTLIAASNNAAWMYRAQADTTKVYAKVKATYYHYQKTTTSKGIVSFRILDAKTNALLSAEKMPGEYIWISEWATFNGDERALSPLQLEITKQRERVPPQMQDLFVEFTKPIYHQLTTKIRDFYRGY